MNARSYWVLLCYFTQIYFQFTSPNCIVILPTNHINVVSGNSNRSALAGPLLWSLHWLPDNFKLAKLCYLVTSFQQPGYLADLISPYSQSRSLRSSTQKFLSIPPHNLDTAACRFSVAAPRLWNSLPLNC